MCGWYVRTTVFTVKPVSLTEVAVSVGVHVLLVGAVEGVRSQVVHLDRPGPVVRPRRPHHNQLLEMKTAQTRDFNHCFTVSPTIYIYCLSSAGGKKREKELRLVNQWPQTGLCYLLLTTQPDGTHAALM